MTKPTERKGSMNTRLRVATLAALASIAIVAIASMAQGSNGQPLILGHDNTSTLDTTIHADGSAVGLDATSSEYGLIGRNYTGGEGAGVLGSARQGAAGVEADGSHGSDALSTEGRTDFNGPVYFVGSGQTTVPAGSRSQTVSVPAQTLEKTSHALAMLQQQRSAQVSA